MASFGLKSKAMWNITCTVQLTTQPNSWQLQTIEVVHVSTCMYAVDTLPYMLTDTILTNRYWNILKHQKTRVLLTTPVILIDEDIAMQIHNSVSKEKQHQVGIHKFWFKSLKSTLLHKFIKLSMETLTSLFIQCTCTIAHIYMYIQMCVGNYLKKPLLLTETLITQFRTIHHTIELSFPLNLPPKSHTIQFVFPYLVGSPDITAVQRLNQLNGVVINYRKNFTSHKKTVHIK